MSKNSEAFARAKKVIPGGVNSPVRAFKGVGGKPVFIQRGKGSKLYDLEGKEYIDYVGSWGPLILGHTHPVVCAALKAAIDRGTSYGAPTELEIELAELVIEAYPSMDMVRMVNSGTEATLAAIRVARGFTGRDKIIKFEGCYHGHVDNLLVKAGSGATTLGVPDSAGIPADVTKHTLIVPFNDLAGVKEIIKNQGKEIACIILEPVVGNIGVVLPEKGFLEGLRELTQANGIVLIFDEVMTGFRVAYGGVQELYQLKPDLTCLGKIIGGGLPVGAYGGRREIMEKVAPLGPVYQAGTLSGNPLAMTAGIETLKILRQPGIYEKLARSTQKLCQGIAEKAQAAKIPTTCNQIGSMFSLFFTDQKVINYETAKTSDVKRFGEYFWSMLRQGVYLAPSQFEAGFVSLAHSDADIEKTIAASEQAFKEIK